MLFELSNFDYKNIKRIAEPRINKQESDIKMFNKRDFASWIESMDTNRVLT